MVAVRIFFFPSILRNRHRNVCNDLPERAPPNIGFIANLRVIFCFVRCAAYHRPKPI